MPYVFTSIATEETGFGSITFKIAGETAASQELASLSSKEACEATISGAITIQVQDTSPGGKQSSFTFNFRIYNDDETISKCSKQLTVA